MEILFPIFPWKSDDNGNKSRVIREWNGKCYMGMGRIGIKEAADAVMMQTSSPNNNIHQP